MTTDGTLGGDPQSIRAVAAWLNDELAPRVEEAVAVADALICRRAEVWEDDAAQILHAQMIAGARKAYAFAVAIRKRARQLDQIAGVLKQAQDDMEAALDVADQGDLDVVDGWIMPPRYGDAPNDQPENQTPEARMAYKAARHEFYPVAEEHVERAHKAIVDGLIGDDSYDWNQLMFFAGDFVKETASELVTHHPEIYGSIGSGAVLSRLTGRPPSRTPTPAPATGGGLTARVLRVGGPLLTATGIAYSLASGDPPEKALLVTGVSLLGGGFAGGALTVVVAGPPAWTLGLVVALGAFISSTIAGSVYDNIEPAREKLLRYCADLDPGRQQLPD